MKDSVDKGIKGSFDLYKSDLRFLIPSEHY